MNIRNQLIALSITLAVASAQGLVASAADNAELLKQAKITKSAAEATAVKSSPKGKLIGGELIKDNGVLVWCFSFKVKKGLKKVEIDATTGKLAGIKLDETKAK